MATLSVLKFNGPSGAHRVLLALQGMQERQLINLEDAAVVTWPEGRKKPQTRELHSMAGGGAALPGPGPAALDLRLYRHRRTVSLEPVQDLLHPVDHRHLEPGLGLYRLVLIALDHDLIVHS